MEIKEFFDSNFSHLMEDYSCPDHKTAFNEILERTMKMEKSKEIRHRLLGVVGGIAGTAAVLTGAVFGLNWLNEHGGLREGGIESSNGAGYHDTAADTTYAHPDVTITQVIVPEDCVYRFNRFTMKPRQYNYDGMTLEFTYDITYADGIPAEPEKDIALRVFDGKVKVHPEDTTQLLFTNGNTAEIMWKYTSLEVLESLEIWIMPGNESAISADMTEQYKFTFEISEDSPYLSVDTDKYIGKAETDMAKLTHFNICKNTVGFVVENYSVGDHAFEAAINYTDGTSEPLAAEIFCGNDMSAEIRQYFLYKLYGTDINTVKSVTVNGREINADGSDEIKFENFIGMTKDEARAYLEKNNRNFDFIEMESDEPAGIIFKQEPPTGTLVSSSMTATLYVSSGLEHTDTNYGINIEDTIEFSDCTVNVSGIERYGNTVKLTLDAYAKENCDMNDVGFCVYEYHEDDEPENRVYVATFSDLGEADNGHLREEITFTPDLPAGTERTYSLRKYHFSKSENDETITFRVTGEDYDNIYSDDHEYVGKGIEGEEIRISSLRINPLTISFRTDSFNFKSLADSFNLAPNFSVKLRNGETMTYDKGELTDDNGNTICSFSSGTDDTSGGNIRYIFIATEPIFDVNEIDSITILGAEIQIIAE